MNSAHEACLHLSDLLRRERGARAEFLLALSDFDRRRQWTELGYTSLFAFLVRELRLSKAAAFFRKTAVDLLHAFPDLVEPIRDGRLSLSVLPELARCVTPENRGELVPRFFHFSRRAARELEAELAPAPAPPLRDVVTDLPRTADSPSEPQPPQSMTGTQTVSATQIAGAMPEPARPGELALVPGAELISRLPVAVPAAAAPVPAAAVPAMDAVPVRAAAPTLAVPRPSPPPRDEVVPLTATLSRLHTTVSRGVLQKIEKARDALAHAKPGASTGEILEAALDLLLAKQARRKGVVERPRMRAQTAPTTPTTTTTATTTATTTSTSTSTSTSTADPTYIPAEVRRAVWLRDGGRCQYRLASGEICGSTHALEFDHVIPSALRGPSTVDNVRVCCRAHNQKRAREVFGEHWIAAAVQRRRAAQG